MRLYELTNNYEYLMRMIENEEYDEQALLDTWESLDEAIDDKAINTAYVVKNLMADEKAIADEIKRLQARKETVTNAIDRLKEGVLFAMATTGKDRIKGELLTVSIRNNAESVNVKDVTKIPNDYFVPQPPKLNKAGLKKAIQDGMEIEGAELVRNKSLQIR